MLHSFSGEETVNRSNQKFLKMSGEDMEKIKTTEIALFRELERPTKKRVSQQKRVDTLFDYFLSV
ncbi:MAG: hypothetical protein ABF651_11980 [Sporolactobacillus sp.]